jgi:GrpB-like predicted nucleotidyltransferase (UPF0157 family)
MHPCDATWQAEFMAIRAHLSGVLGSEARQVSHIGSTSIPGLAAKDIIDIQVGVGGLSPAIASKLVLAGYEPVGDCSCDHMPAGQCGSTDGWRKLFFRQRPGDRPCHIHVRVQGSPNHRYALLFRDYLRAHDGARLILEKIKRELARLHGNDEQAYYAVKDPVCDLIWQVANEWAERSGWRIDEVTDA